MDANSRCGEACNTPEDCSDSGGDWNCFAGLSQTPCAGQTPPPPPPPPANTDNGDNIDDSTIDSGSSGTTTPPVCTGDVAVDAILSKANIARVSRLGDAQSVYTWAGFCQAVRLSQSVGVGALSQKPLGLLLGLKTSGVRSDDAETHERNGGVANVLSFLAQCMWESGGDAPWSACDENNYSGKEDAACSQREDNTPKYHELGMGNADSCGVDASMAITASTWASWTPGPMQCGPGTATEQCCWWGRGAIQLTGPYNYGRFQKDMVAKLPGRFKDMDICTDPGLICKDEELKWMGALYYWATTVQQETCFNPTLDAFVRNDFDTAATTPGCLSFPRGCGGSVNNGQWSWPAHRESARLGYFHSLAAAVKPYLNDPSPSGGGGSSGDAQDTATTTEQTATTTAAAAAATDGNADVDKGGAADPFSREAGFKLVGYVTKDTAWGDWDVLDATLHPRYDDIVFSSIEFDEGGAAVPRFQQDSSQKALAKGHIAALQDSGRRVFASIGSQGTTYPCNADPAVMAGSIVELAEELGFDGVDWAVRNVDEYIGGDADVVGCGKRMADVIESISDSSMSVMVSSSVSDLDPSSDTVSSSSNLHAPLLAETGSDETIAVHTKTFGPGSPDGSDWYTAVVERALQLDESFQIEFTDRRRRRQQLDALATSAMTSAAAQIRTNMSTGVGTRNVGERVVIYMDWKISWSDLGGDIKSAIEQGATHVVLGFFMSDRGPADAAQVWAQMTDGEKQEVMAHAKSQGAKVMVSAGGATENVEGFVLQNSPTGDEYGKAAALWCKEHMLDGVDFDLELSPGNSAPFKDGTFISWAVAATKAARLVLGPSGIISHAPQAPYFSPAWAGPKAGYVDIYKQTGSDIDFFFIQYYNQGVGIYDTSNQIFLDPGDAWAAGSAIVDLTKAGIPSDRIVVGKPVAMTGMANNGMVEALTLAKWINSARTNSLLKYQGGVGGWMWATGDAETITWLNFMASTIENGVKENEHEEEEGKIAAAAAAEVEVARSRRNAGNSVVIGTVASPACQAWSDDNVECDSDVCIHSSVGKCIAPHDKVCYALDDSYPDACPTSTTPCCKGSSSSNSSSSDKGGTDSNADNGDTDGETATTTAATEVTEEASVAEPSSNSDDCKDRRRQRRAASCKARSSENVQCATVYTCWVGSSGPCIATHNNVCYEHNANFPDSCPPGTEPCCSADGADGNGGDDDECNDHESTTVHPATTTAAADNNTDNTDNTDKGNGGNTDTSDNNGNGGAVATGAKKIIGYFTNWAQYRASPAKFFPEDIDATLLTHVCYAFAMINPRNQVVPFEWNDVVDWNPAAGLYARFHVHVRKQNPSIKTLISLGGWTFNEKPATKHLFTTMVSSSKGRAEFIASCIAFARLHTFDGVDIDWEYPGHVGQGGRPEDKAKFTLLLKEFRAAITAEAVSTGKDALLLTIAVGAGTSTVDNGYEVAKIHQHLDWIGVMSYDVKFVYSISPFYSSPSSLTRFVSRP